MSHKAAMKNQKQNSPGSAILFIADDPSQALEKAAVFWKYKKIACFRDTSRKDDYGAMSKDQAEEIKDYAQSVSGSVHTLIISCPAGISRSPAIAAGILKGLGYSDMLIWKNPAYSPNVLCYQRMLKAFGKSRIPVPFKKHASKCAFRDSIRRARKRRGSNK